MAYNGGYDGGGGRPYGSGPGPQRPPPQRQPPGPGGPQQFNGPSQQYDQYQDGYDYGYDNYGNGYDQGYGGQYEDMNYGRGGPPNDDYPPHDYYEPGPPGSGPGPNGPMRGGRGGRGPVPGGRGGSMGSPGGRGGPYPSRGGFSQGPPGPGNGYPPGRGGRPGPPERTGYSDPTPQRRPTMNGPGPTSPVEQGLGSGPFPTFPGAQRRNEMMDEQQLMDHMAEMHISGQRPNQRGPNGPGPQRGPPMRPPGNGYGGPGLRGPPQPYSDYPDQRGPPGPGHGQPNGGYEDEGFGPPARSMTLPMRDLMDMRHPGPPPRRDTAPQNQPMGRGLPARPNTAQAMRGPPPRGYPPSKPPPQTPYMDQAYPAGPPGPPRPPGPPDSGYGGQQRPASFDEFYNYYDDRNSGGDYPAQNPPSAQSEVPNFDAAPSHRPRGSFDQHMQVGNQEQQQRGPGRLPEVNRTKSQPDLRNSQTAIFEMAGDIPEIPPMPNGNQFQQPPQEPQGGPPQPGPFPERSQSFQRRSPPGPGGPPMPGPGLPSGPAPYRPAQSAPPANPDSLPSHPVPIRPGHMLNSLVNVSDRPPPVRNYGGPPQQGPPPPSITPSSSSSSAPPPSLNIPQPVVKEAEPPVTIEELEQLRAAVKNNPNDQASALRLAKRLVEASTVLVPNLPDPKARARSRDRYLVDAHKILRKLEKQSNTDAMFFLADCLGRGMFGSEPDNAHAFSLYQSAAKLGHAAAAYRTAVCCEIGNEDGGGTRKDPLKATQWYKRAATLGDTPAMYKVGMILLKGLLGQPKNPREAIGWLKRAAECADSENPHALHELALLYESAGENDPLIRDERYAFELFEKAAQLGYKFSQFRLGAAYEYGLMGCQIDPRLSIHWYSQAAMQEEHQSELALAGWYLTGSEGVLAPNNQEAYLWAKKAALAGLAKAEYAMGYFTEEGIGVPENLEDAKRWYWRAAAQDYPKARARLEQLKRLGKNAGRSGERISRSKIGKQQEGECAVM